MEKVRERELPRLKTMGCFIGGAISNLSPEGKEIALRTFGEIADQVNKRWGWEAIVPALVEMPASRVGDVARGLNRYLRTSVCDCYISILSLWSPYSNGTAYEISSMTAVGVPAAFFRHESFPLPETFYRPELDILVELTFESDIDLVEKLFSWLDDPGNFEKIEERAEIGRKVRRFIEGLGTAQRLERARCDRGISINALAAQAGLPVPYVQDVLSGNYSALASLTVNHLIRLTHALREPLFDALSPYHIEKGLHRIDRLILQTGIISGWSIEEFTKIVSTDVRWKRRVESLPLEEAFVEIRKRCRAVIDDGCKRSRRGNGHKQGRLF